METYTTLDGAVLDLTDLSDEERAFLGRAVQAYRAGTSWDDFDALISDRVRNPLLQAAEGWVTSEILHHPLYRALEDLLGRIAIRDGTPPDPQDDPARDPFDDEALPLMDAARRRRIPVQTLQEAINRGEIVAAPANSDASQCVVSRNSVDRWQPRPRATAG